MEQLSVCYVAFAHYPGQGATDLFEYSRNLAKMGHSVKVIAAAKFNETMNEVVDKVVVQRIPVKTTKKLSLENVRFSYLARRALKKTIERDLPDIIHVFSYAGSFLIRLGSISPKRTKWIYDVRSGPIRDFPWYLFGRVTRWFELTLFDVVFVIDKAVIESELRREMFVAPIGVDLQMFKRVRSRCVLSQYGVDERETVLVYSGSLAPQRRIYNLIYAFRKASKVTENLRLILLGDGENLDRLRLLAERLLISDKVVFLGYVDHRKMPEYLSAADIAVSYIPLVPAFDRQPPQKTIEYLACSLPVIATETLGNRRFIVHERNGLLTKDDPDSLSEAIIRLSQNAGLRVALSKNARSSAEDYDWKAIVERRILPAYQETLGM